MKETTKQHMKNVTFHYGKRWRRYLATVMTILKGDHLHVLSKYRNRAYLRKTI